MPPDNLDIRSPSGAIKPMHDNTLMLINVLKELPVGGIAFKADLSREIGLDVTLQPNAGGGSTYLTGAVRALENKYGMVFRPLPRADAERMGRGPALVHLDAEGKIAWASKRAKSASKIGHNAQKTLSTIADEEYAELAPNVRVALDTTRVVLKMHKHIGQAVTQQRIENAVVEKNAQLSINQTLQTLLMPTAEASRSSEERQLRAQARRRY